MPKSAVGVRTILYVEDNPANAALVSELLSRRDDLRLITAPDGPAGVALAMEAIPDAILMDINLPGLNGVEALILLRNDPRTAHIPVLAVSANGGAQDVERALGAGFQRYITKPIRLGEFMTAVDGALEQGHTW